MMPVSIIMKAINMLKSLAIARSVVPIKATKISKTIINFAVFDFFIWRSEAFVRSLSVWVPMKFISKAMSPPNSVNLKML